MSDEHHDHAGHADHGHEDHGHEHHGHEHHGHANDRGLRAMLRYLRWAPQMWRSDVNDAVIELVAPTKGDVVVDIGAGMGAGTVRAAKTGARVIAVEPTPFMRRILATRRWFQRARKRIVVSNGTAEELPTADGTIDALWAVNTMHHWVDPAKGAIEVVRVLKPAGRVVLVDEDFEDPMHPEFERFGDHHSNDQGDGGHHGFSMVDAGHMGDLLRSAGLSDVVAEKRQLAGRPVIAVTGRAQ